MTAQDPLNCMNNVGRSSFGIRQVQKCLFEALTTLKATMVRVNQDGKEASGTKMVANVWLKVRDCGAGRWERGSVECANK